MSNKLVGRGQYTLVELHDGKNMQLHLNSNTPFIQSYSLETKKFSPDYSERVLKITPELYFTGATGNQISLIKNPVWKINDKDPIYYGGVVSSSLPYELSINKNMVEYNQLHITFTCVVTDPDTKLDIKISKHISFSKQTIAPLTPTMMLEYPNGCIFKNEIYSELTAVCKLVKGNKDVTSDIEYIWYSVNGDVEKLISNDRLVSGQGTNTLRVSLDYVNSKSEFKCEIRYRGSTYSEYVTFNRQSDPYLLVVENKNGDKMKNGEGVIICEAHLERGKVIVDDTVAESMFNFQWFKYNKYTGEKDVSWRNPVARRIELTKKDIDRLSTFICEVTYKNKNIGLPYKLPIMLR